MGLVILITAFCVWMTASSPSRHTERRSAPALTLDATLERPEEDNQAPDPLEPPAGSKAHRRWVEGRERARRYQARPADPSTPKQLAKVLPWWRSIRTMAGLKAAQKPKTLAKGLKEALLLAENPVARQNIIFLAVLTLPLEEARPWLAEVAAQGDDDDREDVTCALAFSGDTVAREEFRRLATVPADADVHKLRDLPCDIVHIANEGTVDARRILRSYHCIEVLDRDPYFDETLVYHPWLPHPAPSDGLSRELLEAWLRRYPGHPGGDDMAWRLGRIHTRQGKHLMAARWYSRAATLPDKDVTTGSILRLLATAELMLSPAQLDLLAHEKGLDTPNRRLVRYVWIRKVAAREGFVQALRLSEAFARNDPDSPLGRAWRNRIAAKPAKGLDSGVAPLPADDPLRRRLAAEKVRVPGATSRLGTGYDDLEYFGGPRLQPKLEPFVLDSEILAAQLRVWETLAELELRTVRARGSARGDLLYKQAAIFYHDSRVLFPAYGRQSVSFGWLFGLLGEDVGRKALVRVRRRFMEDSYSMSRALELFRRIEWEAPAYPRMDKVLFSQGMAHKKLLDYAPMRWIRDDEKDVLVRAVIDSFERCARRYPSSPLARSAKLAAAWWRRQ